MIFSAYYLAAMALALADWRGRLARWRICAPALPAAAWCAVLLVTYALQIAVLAAAAQRAPWPIPLVPPVQANGDAIAIATLLAAAVQTFALAGLYRANPSRTVVVAGTIAMLALSLAAPVIVNADLYAYVGNGVLGLGAYTPPNVPFAGDLAAINARWGTPVPAATYGPLWLVVARAVVSRAPTLAAKLVTFRVLGGFAFVALLFLLRAAGVPSRLVALVALNPGFALQFVLDAHNDALAIAMVVAAAPLARRLPIVACGLIIAAALVKLPYVLAGLPVLATIVPKTLRYLVAAFAVAVAIAVSWLGGGRPYFDALTSYARSSQLESVLHVAAALAAFALLLSALAGMRRLRTGVWLVPMLGAYTAPWYVAWSLPYALARRRVLAYLAIWFPLVSALAEPSLVRPWTLVLLVPVLVATAIL